MTIFWPTNTTEITDNIRNTIGRDIIIATPASGTACTICSLNPITGRSVDPFCPQCSGYYYINAFAENIVQAHIFYGYVDEPWRVSAGDIEKGIATVQIKYTTTTKAIVDTALYYIVEGKKYFSNGIKFRGVPEINRILVVLKEQEG